MTRQKLRVTLVATLTTQHFVNHKEGNINTDNTSSILLPHALPQSSSLSAKVLAVKRLNLSQLKADFRAACQARGVDPLKGAQGVELRSTEGNKAARAREPRQRWDLGWLGVEVVVAEPRYARRSDLQSKITVKNRSSILGEHGVPIGCLRARKTEIAALGDGSDPLLLSLPHVLSRVVYLELVASQPVMHPEYRMRPARPLYGTGRWNWIAGQLGSSPSRVRDMLDSASRYLLN